MEKIEIVLNEERDVTLMGYLQPRSAEFGKLERRPAVVVFPGGGYRQVSERCGDPVALSYVAAGFQAFVLRYSVGEHATWPNPLHDAEAALRLIRANAGEWGIVPDRIAVAGFSAGGHLAATLASMGEERPNAAILGYACVGAESVQELLAGAPDAIAAVNGHTCPCFLFATRNDAVVPVKNTIDFIGALDRCGVAFEAHIYAYGPHGFSTGRDVVRTPGAVQCGRVADWVGDSVAWLKDVLGAFDAEGLKEPVCPKRLNGDFEDVLSVDCTVAHLMRVEGGRQIVGAIMEQAKGHEGADERSAGLSEESVRSMLSRMTLREMLGYGNASEDVIGGLDAKLRQIPNVL